MSAFYAFRTSECAKFLSHRWLGFGLEQISRNRILRGGDRVIRSAANGGDRQAILLSTRKRGAQALPIRRDQQQPLNPRRACRPLPRTGSWLGQCERQDGDPQSGTGERGVAVAKMSRVSLSRRGRTDLRQHPRPRPSAIPARPSSRERWAASPNDPNANNGDGSQRLWQDFASRRSGSSACFAGCDLPPPTASACG